MCIRSCLRCDERGIGVPVEGAPAGRGLPHPAGRASPCDTPEVQSLYFADAPICSSLRAL